MIAIATSHRQIVLFPQFHGRGHDLPHHGDHQAQEDHDGGSEQQGRESGRGGQTQQADSQTAPADRADVADIFGGEQLSAGNVPQQPVHVPQGKKHRCRAAVEGPQDRHPGGIVQGTELPVVEFHQSGKQKQQHRHQQGDAPGGEAGQLDGCLVRFHGDSSFCHYHSTGIIESQ